MINENCVITLRQTRSRWEKIVYTRASVSVRRYRAILFLSMHNTLCAQIKFLQLWEKVGPVERKL